ncbi:scavenger receptor class B member 1-like, partial [Tropilaelaps mercedesae]
YPDSLAEIAHLIEPKLPIIDGKVGFLLGKNATNDGLYSVFSGANNHLDLLNVITEFQNSTTIPYYDEPCNEIRGTNGELYPPFFDAPPESIEIFSPVMCRPWPLHRNGSTTVRGINSVVFSSGEDLFTKTNNETMDRCFEKMPYMNGVKGTFDASACQFGQPIVITLPHFFKADPELHKLVTGLEPDARKHDFSLSVFEFGIVTDLQVRLQVNIPVRVRPGANTGPLILYPIWWQELIFLEQDRNKLSDIIWDQAVRPKVLIQSFLIGLGLLLIATFIIVAITFYIIDRKGKTPDDDELLRDEERVERRFEVSDRLSR